MYELIEDGYAFATCEGSLEDAIRLIEELTDECYEDQRDETPIFVEIRIEEDGETVWIDTRVYDAAEPPCCDDSHDWQSPWPLVGGIAENPGVWRHGGGVIIDECCMRCGCRRQRDTWSQNPLTGEQGFTTTTYDQDFYDIEDIAILKD